MADVERIRRLQEKLRWHAQQFTVEEALNALSAVIAEAVVSVPANERVALVGVVGRMVTDYVKSAQKTEKAMSPGLIIENSHIQ